MRALSNSLERLEGEYDLALSTLQVEEEERKRLHTECLALKAQLEEEEERRVAQGRKAAAELHAREALLDAALVDSHAKATMLSSVLTEHNAAQAKGQSTGGAGEGGGRGDEVWGERLGGRAGGAGRGGGGKEDRAGQGSQGRAGQKGRGGGSKRLTTL